MNLKTFGGWMYNQIIKKSYFINLARSTKRRNIFEQQASKIGIENVERYEAIDIVEYLKENQPTYYNKNEDSKEKIYGYGLTYSNLCLMLKIINDDSIKDDDYVAIYEDDAVFLDDFHNEFNEIFSYFENRKFDIINLGSLIQPIISDKNEAVSNRLVKINTPGIFLTQAIVYRKGVIKNIVEIFSAIFKEVNDSSGIKTSDIMIDHVMSNQIYPKFESYSCYPPITYQLADRSLIQNNEYKFINPILRQRKKIINGSILKSCKNNIYEQCKLENFKDSNEEE